MATPFKRNQERRDYQYVLQQQTRVRRDKAKEENFAQQKHSFSQADSDYGKKLKIREAAERKKYLDNFLNVRL